MAGVNIASSKEGKWKPLSTPIQVTFSSLLAPKAFAGKGRGWREGRFGGRECLYEGPEPQLLLR